MELIKELTKLGLKDKEAAVYLACLELGPSPVQFIARKAHVVRATTYVVVESLMQMGLVTKYKEGKKTLFSAEPPRQLLRLLEKQREDIEAKHHDLEDLLPELQIITKAAGGKPTVRYFEGKEGLRVMRQEIVMYSRPGDVILNLTPIDHIDAVFPEDEKSYYRQRAAKKIRSKTLFTTKSSKAKEKLLSESYLELSERRYISPELFPSTSGMTIFRDRIAIGSFTGKLMGVVVESESMANMMRHIFGLAWIGAEIVTRRDKKSSANNHKS
ncbi:MAG: TrmB family transcriptional regulator [Acidobacteriota bacterium]